MPASPRPAAARSTSTGKCFSWSQRIACGASSAAAKSRAIFWMASWSAVSSKGLIRDAGPAGARVRRPTRSRALPGFRVQRVEPDRLALRQHMALHGGLHLRPGEGSGKIEARHVEGIDAERVSMHALVVPGRAGPVIAAILPLHVAGHEQRVVVDAAHAVFRRADRLAFFRDPF